MSTISLFLGAGASFQFNKPTTAQFKKNMLMKDWAKQQPIAKSFLETDELRDIEHVLQAMQEVRVSMSPSSTYPYLGKYLKYGKPAGEDIKPFASTFQYISREINRVESMINKEIFSEYDWKDDDNQTLADFYGKLFELLLKDTDRIFVGTTNYDQAIEKFCMLPGQDYSCIDGFHLEDTKFVWKNENFTKDYNTGNEKLIFLYKLHGSLNWAWDGSKFIKNPNDPVGLDDAVLIFPTVSPKIPTEKDPYKTLISEFEKKLLESDICIVIGFSFRDTHINSFFSEFIENNKTLIIVSPHCRENYSEYFQKNELLTSEAHVDWTKSSAPKNVKFIQNYVKKETHNEIFEAIKNNLTP